MQVTTMQNELVRIGVLIYDLKNNVGIGPDGSGFDFFEEEFRRISMSLGYQWYEKMPGYAYLLDFHRVECLRLMEMVIKLESFQIELSELGRQNDFLQDLHTELIRHFAELLSRIDKMLGSSNLTLQPFSLN